MTTDLDTRLRSAGVSLRAAVEDIEPQPLPSPGPVRRPLLAAAALLVVVAAIAAVVALRHDPESDLSTDPDAVPRLVLDEAVVGIPATGAVELPAEGGLDGVPITVTLYDAPTGGGSAEIGVLRFSFAGDPELSWEPAGDSEPVTVRGAPAWFTEGEPFGASVSWAEGDEVTSVASHQLGRDQLLAAVEAGTATDGSFVPGSAGPGLAAPERVGRPTVVDLATLSPLPVGAVGHGVGYQSDEDVDRSALLAVVAGDESDLLVMRWIADAETQVEVRGGPGWLGSRQFDSDGSVIGDGSGEDEPSDVVSESHTLVWEEAPGVIATLTATGFTADEALHIAQQGIVTAPEAEWAALVEASGSATPLGEEAAIAGDDGTTAWSVYLDDGTLCISTETGSSGVESCGSPPGGAEVLQDEAGNPLAVYGILPEGAVDVRAGDGTPLGASMAPSEGGVIVYAITLDEGPPPAEVVFVGADGSEVGRIEVGSAPAVEVESPAPPGP